MKYLFIIGLRGNQIANLAVLEVCGRTRGPLNLSDGLFACEGLSHQQLTFPTQAWPYVSAHLYICQQLFRYVPAKPPDLPAQSFSMLLRFLFFAFLTLAAAAGERSYIISFPKETPKSVVVQAISDFEREGATITHTYGKPPAARRPAAG